MEDNVTEMAQKGTRFEREKYWVEQLLHLLECPIEGLLDPKVIYGQNEETGADVVLVSNGTKIGIQVTELDSGAGVKGLGPGALRREEKKRVQDAKKMGRPNSYGGWAPHAPDRAIRNAIQKKSLKLIDKSKFCERWLLISANLNDWGALDSTFVGPSTIDANFLNKHTADLMTGMKDREVECVFFHLIVGRVLFRWKAAEGWRALYRESNPGPDDPEVQEIRKRLKFS